LNKIRVGIVNYLNTRPLLKGLTQLSLDGEIELSQNYPAQIAEDLLMARIDIGLVPVAVLPRLPQAAIIGSHCIATKGIVASVCLFSTQPLETLDSIYLDYQSRTSVQLLRILLRDHWKKEVTFLPSTSSAFIEEINGQRGGLIIGDRALNDLGDAWHQMTGLPFVFAVWVATTPLEDKFVNKFIQANELGMNSLPALALENASSIDYDLMRYYTENIDYRFTDDKREAMNHFLSLCSTLPTLSTNSESKNI
jgi:chorismate dehydratase